MASVAKTIELSAESSDGFEAAIRQGIARACDSVNDVTGAWIKEQKIVVENGAVSAYQVHMKVTFIIRD
jgi:hypothetical protein